MSDVRPADWTLYDGLIAGLPEDVHVVDALVNRRAVVRTSEGAVGYALGYDGGPPVPTDAWLVRGRPLREVAAYATSWNLRLARP